MDVIKIKPNLESLGNYIDTLETCASISNLTILTSTLDGLARKMRKELDNILDILASSVNIYCVITRTGGSSGVVQVKSYDMAKSLHYSIKDDPDVTGFSVYETYDEARCAAEAKQVKQVTITNKICDTNKEPFVVDIPDSEQADTNTKSPTKKRKRVTKKRKTKS